jgi:uracil-DNA glycosylase family 4
MPNYTPHTGPINPSHEGSRLSQLIVIPESPWKTEIYRNRPLVGASGLKWDGWLMKVGIDRSKLRIENLYPFKPPTREITSVKDSELIPWIYDLHKRIAALPDPILIVTMGNYATFALTGKGKVRASIRNHFSQIASSASEADKKAGITSLRGSIYLYQDYNGRYIKVIPVIHPAAVLQHAKWEKRCIKDWERIARESKTRDYPVPRRRHIVDPSEGQVEGYTKFVEANWKDLALATDVETWGRTLSCVGYSYDPKESITIPTNTERLRQTFMPYIERLCSCQAAKVLCNGLFDWYWFDEYGIDLREFFWDVQLMHHAFNPVDSHSLDYLASIYTNQPFWKDEAKDAEEIIKYATNLEALWVYNGLDCCVTRELLPVMYEKLMNRGLVEFYFNHYQKMLWPLFRMARNGIRVDRVKQKAWSKKLKQEMKEIRAKLEEAAGENLFATERKGYWREPTEEEWGALLNEGDTSYDDKGIPKAKHINRENRKKFIETFDITYCISGKNAGKFKCYKEVDKKDFSPAKLQRFFIDTLGLPIKKKRRKGKDEASESLDEGVIRGYTAKYPHKIKNYGNLLLAHREKKKERDYLRGAHDPDGRIRCSYKMLTEAGRLASSGNPMGRGYNLQNLKR